MLMGSLGIGSSSHGDRQTLVCRENAVYICSPTIHCFYSLRFAQIDRILCSLQMVHCAASSFFAFLASSVRFEPHPISIAIQGSPSVFCAETRDRDIAGLALWFSPRPIGCNQPISHTLSHRANSSFASSYAAGTRYGSISAIFMLITDLSPFIFA